MRAEALVRNVGPFSRFLELAALEAGGIVDPLTRSRTRAKLTKSSRHLFFDLGVRRLAAGEGRRLPRDRLGQLFGQFVGLELIRQSRLTGPGTSVRFWRNPDGPEVDWVVERPGTLVPVETKWTDVPGGGDIRHVEVFLREYAEASRGFLVCRAPRRVKLSDRVTAVPWQEVPSILD